MTGLETRPDTLTKAIEMAQSKEYALGIEEEQRPVLSVQRSVNFVDHQQEAHKEETQQLNKQLGELVNVLYLDRRDNRKPLRRK